MPSVFFEEPARRSGTSSHAGSEVRLIRVLCAPRADIGVYVIQESGCGRVLCRHGLGRRLRREIVAQPNAGAVA